MSKKFQTCYRFQTIVATELSVFFLKLPECLSLGNSTCIEVSLGLCVKQKIQHVTIQKLVKEVPNLHNELCCEITFWISLALILKEITAGMALFNAKHLSFYKGRAETVIRVEEKNNICSFHIVVRLYRLRGISWSHVVLLLNLNLS